MSNAPLSCRNTALAPKVSAAVRGVWLVLGWLAFWFGTAAYPCQAHPAPSGRLDQTAAIELATGQRINPAHLDSHPWHDDGTCHYLSAPAIGAPVTAAAAGSGNPNVDPAAPLALEPRQLSAAVSAAGILPVSHPPPHTPLYLRTQRLLI